LDKIKAALKRPLSSKCGLVMLVNDRLLTRLVVLFLDDSGVVALSRLFLDDCAIAIVVAMIRANGYPGAYGSHTYADHRLFCGSRRS
jgi:hypothetical protein